METHFRLDNGNNQGLGMRFFWDPKSHISEVLNFFPDYFIYENPRKNPKKIEERNLTIFRYWALWDFLDWDIQSFLNTMGFKIPGIEIFSYESVFIIIFKFIRNTFNIFLRHTKHVED